MSRIILAILCAVSLTPAQEATARKRVVPYPVFEHRDFTRAVEEGERTRTGAPGPKAWTNYARYKIDVELVPKTAKLGGRIEMTYVNRSPDRIGRVNIHLRQNLHKEGMLRNRYVEVTGGMTVSNVRVGDVEVKPQGRRAYRIRGSVMSLRLPEAIPSGGEATISMDYSFTVPRAGRAPRMGHESNGVFYLGYWYPQFAVYDDVHGWVADNYMGNGEFYMGYADYDITFKAPHGWIVRATGELQNPKKVLTSKVLKRLEEARETRDIVQVVGEKEWGPGKATRRSGSGKLSWHFVAKNVRDVAVSTSNRYVWDATHAVVKDRDGPGQDGVCMIHSVYEPGTGAWHKGAEHARHTIEYMSEHLYPYPWPHMTACEGIIGGGMEYPMMTIIGGRGSERSLYSVMSHELIHMWFPMIVGQNEKRFAWMDEGITSFYQAFTQADYWKSDGWEARSVRSYRLRARGGREVESMRHGDRHSPSSFGFASYGKPAAVMHQLRAQLGDELFTKAMRTYVKRWAFKHPYPNDLFNTFKDVTGQDLDWYFRTWMYETWTLDQAVAGVSGDGKGTRIIIEDRGLATGPTVIEITYDDGRTERRKIAAEEWLAGATSKTVEVGPGVKSVVIDPDRMTLDLEPRNNSWEKGEAADG